MLLKTTKKFLLILDIIVKKELSAKTPVKPAIFTKIYNTKNTKKFCFIGDPPELDFIYLI